MNISEVVSSLITSFGLYGITLPFKDQLTNKPIPIENVIRNVLTTVTIPQYSELVPWKQKGDININDLKVFDRRNCIYFLPAFLTITPIKYIISVTIPFNGLRGTYGGSVPSYAYGMGELAEGVAVGMLSSMLGSQLRAEPSWEWIKPNKIQLFNYPNCKITIKAACKHLPNGESIEDSCYDSFLELATLDLKMFLYNNLKLYDNVPTAFGEVRLKTEDYQNAESERTTLLNEWRDKYHVDEEDWIAWM